MSAEPIKLNIHTATNLVNPIASMISIMDAFANIDVDLLVKAVQA